MQFLYTQDFSVFTPSNSWIEPTLDCVVLWYLLPKKSKHKGTCVVQTHVFQGQLNMQHFLKSSFVFTCRQVLRKRTYELNSAIVHKGLPPFPLMYNNQPANTGDSSSILELGRFAGGGNGNPLQYSCLENSIDREAWWADYHPWGSQRVRHNWAHMHAIVHKALAWLAVSVITGSP